MELQLKRFGETGYQLEQLIADHLPKRQQEALLYHAQGLTDKQAAELMNCAPNTVKHLRKEIHYKCKSHSGAQLITKAFQNGYLRFLSLALTWSIGLGTFITPQDTSADNTPNDDMQIRFRNRPQRTQGARGRFRKLRDCTPEDINNAIYWDDETQTLYTYAHQH